MREAGGVGNERIELGFEQHKDHAGVFDVARVGVTAAQLAGDHATLVHHLDDGGLRALAVGHHLARYQRALDHAGQFLVVGHGGPDLFGHRDPLGSNSAVAGLR